MSFSFPFLFLLRLCDIVYRTILTTLELTKKTDKKRNKVASILIPTRRWVWRLSHHEEGVTSAGGLPRLGFGVSRGEVTHAVCRGGKQGQEGDGRRKGAKTPKKLSCRMIDTPCFAEERRGQRDKGREGYCGEAGAESLRFHLFSLNFVSFCRRSSSPRRTRSART